MSQRFRAELCRNVMYKRLLRRVEARRLSARDVARKLDREELEARRAVRRLARIAARAVRAAGILTAKQTRSLMCARLVVIDAEIRRSGAEIQILQQIAAIAHFHDIQIRNGVQRRLYKVRQMEGLRVADHDDHFVIARRIERCRRRLLRAKRRSKRRRCARNEPAAARRRIDQRRTSSLLHHRQRRCLFERWQLLQRAVNLNAKSLSVGFVRENERQVRLQLNTKQTFECVRRNNNIVVDDKRMNLCCPFNNLIENRKINNQNLNKTKKIVSIPCRPRLNVYILAIVHRRR